MKKLFIAVAAFAMALVGSAQSPVFSPPNGNANLGTTGPQIFQGRIQIPDLWTSIRPYIDPRTFGAAMDGVTDDTVAINAAITAASRSTTNCGLGSTPPSASCTGVVQIPNGALIASQIVMKNNVTLRGTGWNNTVLIQKAGSNRHFIVGTTPATDQRYIIRDLFINGNASNQVGTFDCVHLDSTGSLAGSTRSPRHLIQDVWASSCGQDAFDIFGDAGSAYLINVKGLNSGRYGLNLDVYDSHVDVGEFASNGIAGINLGTHGNGSVTSTKDWGNGPSGAPTGTVGDGIRVNSGNYRLVDNEVQDNVCNGLNMIGVIDTAVSGLLTDGNGNTGGGNGCAGIVMNGSNNNHISGVFRALTDAGTSDYAIAWVGTNANNIMDLVVDTPKVALYSGTSNNNTIRTGGTINQVITSQLQLIANGAITRGFSDNQVTRSWECNASNGICQMRQGWAGTSGITIFGVGGPNDAGFSQTNTRYLAVNYAGNIYSLANGCAGTGCPAVDFYRLNIPTMLLPSGTQPTCSATGGPSGTSTEGTLWYTKGSASTNGSFQICQNQSGAFSWVTH